LLALFLAQHFHGLGLRSAFVTLYLVPIDALHGLMYYGFGRSIKRALLDFSASTIRGPQDIQVSYIDISVKSGIRTSRIYKPPTTEEKLPVLIWIHGGGFVLGSVASSDGQARRIAKATNMLVVSIGYGLAPEYKFPTQIYDSLASLRWVYEHIEEYGGDKSKIAVSGESAGGNLAAVLALENAKSPHPIPLCAQGLVVPVVAMEVVSSSMSSNRYRYGLSTDSLITYYHLYTTSWEETFDPRVSPLFAPDEDLKKLPPGIILTAEKDILRDQGEAYGNKLRNLGVNITNIRANQTIHIFFARNFDYSQEGLEIFSSTINHFCRGN